jgi:hypothetical protein
MNSQDAATLIIFLVAGLFTIVLSPYGMENFLQQPLVAVCCMIFLVSGIYLMVTDRGIWSLLGRVGLAVGFVGLSINFYVFAQVWFG